MASVNARKPRNVRSVYARPRRELSEEATEPFSHDQDKKISWNGTDRNQKSSRLKNNRNSVTADKNYDKRTAKSCIDVGDGQSLEQEGSSSGEKSKKGVNDGHSTIAKSGIRKSSPDTRTRRARVSDSKFFITSQHCESGEWSADPKGKRARYGGGISAQHCSLLNTTAPKRGRAGRVSITSVHKKSSVLSTEELAEHATAAEKYAHKGSCVRAADCVDAVTSDSKEAFVSTSTLSLLKHKIQNREVVREQVSTDPYDQTITKLKPFVCGICQRRYGSDISLREHERIHQHQDSVGASNAKCPERSGLFGFSCDVCNKAFKLKSTLLRHMPVHAEVKPFVCHMCSKSFSQAQHLHIHLFQHKGERPFACVICNKTYLRNFDLQQHKRIHTGEKPYACNVCGKAFTRMDYLKHHRQIHMSTEPADAKPYKCDECFQTFRKREYLKFHKRRRHADVVQRPFVCQFCSKAFKSKGVLKKHTRIHTCQKDPVVKNRGVSSKMCEICGAKFQKKTGLRLHMMTHTGERPHTCEVCSKGFITKHQWLVHMRLHTGEKPFVCQLCSAAYRSKESLRYHIDAFHFDKRPHTCDVCNRAFKSRKILKDHKLIHSGIKPHVCSECGKCFTQSSQLKNHARTHTGEKPYPCKYCPKSFGSSGSRTRHTRMHTGEKPCKCSKCPAVFTRSEYQKHHMEKVHGISVVRSATADDPCAACTDWSSSSQSVDSEMADHSTASGSYCPGTVSSQTVVVVPQSQLYEGRTVNQGHAEYAGPLMAVQSDDSASSPASDIPSAPTVIIDSAENVHSSNEAEVIVSVDERCVHSSGSSVVCQPLPSIYRYPHVLSGSEVIECSVVDNPVTAIPQLVCEYISGSSTVDEGKEVSAGGMAVMPTGGRGVMPTVIEVQVQPGIQGRPTHVIEVKHSGTVTHSLSTVKSKTEQCNDFPTSPTQKVKTAPSESDVTVCDTRTTGPPAYSETVLTVTGYSASSVADGALCGPHDCSIVHRACDRPDHDCQTVTISSVRKLRNSCCEADNTTGQAVAESQVDTRSTAPIGMLKSTLGYEENVAAVSVVEPQSGSHFPREYFHVFHADGNLSVTVVESHTATDGDPTKSQQEYVSVDPMEGDSSPVLVQKMETIEVSIADPSIGTDAAENHGTTIADDTPLPNSVEEQKHQSEIAVNSNTNKRFNKKGKPTTMRMDASEFGDKLKTRKMTYGKRKKDWICEVCGKGFTTLASLKGHKAMQHKAGDVKTFSCDICHKVLSAKSLLEAHRRKHTGERPFPCDVCSNTYKRATDLRHHILVAHMGRRPFACDLCPKTFTVRNALRDHRLAHQGIKPHQCTACGKSFCQSSSLRTHMRQHTGLRPWMCQYCSRDFSDQSSFTRHQRTHTGEKPFHCQHCPCTFARTEQLKKHIGREHPEDLQNLTTLAEVVASIV